VVYKTSRWKYIFRGQGAKIEILAALQISRGNLSLVDVSGPGGVSVQAVRVTQGLKQNSQEAASVHIHQYPGTSVGYSWLPDRGGQS
jgi:hypothetical protein